MEVLIAYEKEKLNKTNTAINSTIKKPNVRIEQSP